MKMDSEVTKIMHAFKNDNLNPIFYLIYERNEQLFQAVASRNHKINIDVSKLLLTVIQRILTETKVTDPAKREILRELKNIFFTFDLVLEYNLRKNHRLSNLGIASNIYKANIIESALPYNKFWLTPADTKNSLNKLSCIGSFDTSRLAERTEMLLEHSTDFDDPSTASH